MTLATHSATNARHTSDEHRIKPTRIGVVFANLGNINRQALTLLILELNRHLKSTTFEILPIGDLDFPFLMSPRAIKWESLREVFLVSVKEYQIRIQMAAASELRAGSSTFHAPDEIVVITKARDFDEYFLRAFDVRSVEGGTSRVSVLLFGNWKRKMAPPSIMEFISVLLVSEAMCRHSPTFKATRLHYGTRGCIGDFCSDLGEARYKALVGVVCADCAAALARDGKETLITEARAVLDRSWLGKVEDPQSVAALCAKLGFNLFSTRGATDSLIHRLLEGIEGKFADNVLKLAFALLIAVATLSGRWHELWEKVSPIFGQ